MVSTKVSSSATFLRPRIVRKNRGSPDKECSHRATLVPAQAIGVCLRGSIRTLKPILAAADHASSLGGRQIIPSAGTGGSYGK